MKLINLLPTLTDCLTQWTDRPDKKSFDQNYLDPHLNYLQPLLDDFLIFRGVTFFDFLEEVEWKTFRKRVLTSLDPAEAEANVAKKMNDVEKLLGVKLRGEVVLFGAFTMMDGYARFNEGSHRVFLGLDEEFPSNTCRDILITHELTHVAPENRSKTWTDLGLSPTLNHDDMVKQLPTIEHLFGEGLSCLVSEILNPGHFAGSYVYQSKDSYKIAHKLSENINEVVHSVLEHGHYRELYNLNHYAAGVPRFAHYLWAWQWVKSLYESNGKDIHAILAMNSGELVKSALGFKLK